METTHLLVQLLPLALMVLAFTIFIYFGLAINRYLKLKSKYYQTLLDRMDKNESL